MQSVLTINQGALTSKPHYRHLRMFRLQARSRTHRCHLVECACDRRYRHFSTILSLYALTMSMKMCVLDSRVRARIQRGLCRCWDADCRPVLATNPNYAQAEFYLHSVVGQDASESVKQVLDSGA